MIEAKLGAETRDSLLYEARKDTWKVRIEFLAIYAKRDLLYDIGAAPRLVTRGTIEEVFSTFDRNYEASKFAPPPAPEPVRPSVFIGHGHGEKWKELKDQLHEKHGYKVIGNETGARAGHAIRDILDEMVSKASIAFLVFT